MVKKIDSVSNQTVIKSATDGKDVQKPDKQEPKEPLLKMKKDEINAFEIEHTEQSEKEVEETNTELIGNDDNNLQNSVSVKNESYSDVQKLTRESNAITDNQSPALYEFVKAMEDEDGDKIDEFLVQKYPSGTHFTGETNALYEDCKDEGKTLSYNADAFLTHTGKKGGTVIAGGAFEYKSSGSGEDKSVEKNGNAVLGYRHDFGKLANTAKYTGAALVSGSFNDGVKQIDGSIGVEHNPTGFAGSYKIQSLTVGGKTTLKRNFNFTFLDNDKSDEIEESKMPAEEQSLEKLTESAADSETLDDKSETTKIHKTKAGKYFARNKAAGYGLGVKFVMQNADGIDDDNISEYGLVGNYSFSVLNNPDKYKSKKFVITPALGVLDSNKSVKLTSGIEADYKSQSPNGTNLELNAAVNNNTSFALKEKPLNTFTASFTGKVDSKKVTASANATYIKSNQNMKSTSVSANVEYRISDRVSASANAGFTEYKLFDEIQNKCVQFGLGAKVNF